MWQQITTPAESRTQDGDAVGVTLGVTLGGTDGTGAVGVCDVLGVCDGVIVSLGDAEGLTDALGVAVGVCDALGVAVGVCDALGEALDDTLTEGVGLGVTHGLYEKPSSP